MEKVRASIITIGDELLIGQVVDTNSAWMAQKLNAMGIWVHRRVAVGDDREAIVSALDEEIASSSIVLLTGGLGPTADDITKPLLAEYFGGRLVQDDRVLAHVQYLFEKVFRRPGPLAERNLRQAEVPDVCTVLFNQIGTAPGMWFEKNGTIIVSMPGVPIEMKGLMENEVLPRLAGLFELPPVAHRTVYTIGAGESIIADRLVAFEASLPSSIKLAYLPHFGTVRLRLTGDPSLIDDYFSTLCSLVPDITVVTEDISMEAYIGRLFVSRGLTLATAESCTGGTIAQQITSVPGSSHYFLGSVVSYSPLVKTSVLDVAPSSIASPGVVSETVAVEMVRGVLARIPADYAVATTGYVGPDGGPEAPVGTVWVAVGNRDRVVAKVFHFRYDRALNTQLAALNALNLLRLFVLEN